METSDGGTERGCAEVSIYPIVIPNLDRGLIRRIIRKDRVLSSADGFDVMAEVNVLKGLDHPNIVHLWDHFESRDK
jgi:serine/threonine protein kinase